MHRVALALALIVAGCGTVPSPLQSYPPGGAMAHMASDLAQDPCNAEVWVTGVITPNADGSAAIRDDQGVVRNLVWGTHNTAAVEWGRRYRIGGRWFNTPDTLWACGGANAVIPQ